MIEKFLLYIGTIFIFEWIVILVGIIPNLLLGVLNNITGGKFPPYHPLYFGLNTLPSIFMLFVLNWIWNLATDQGIPILAILALIAWLIKALKSPGANSANIHQLRTTIVGIILYLPIHFLLTGVNDIAWW